MSRFSGEFEVPRGIDARYERLEQIGQGGFGVVFKARQRATGQLVAIKQMKLSHEAEEEGFQEQRERFIRETKLIAALSSPHVVRLLDAGFEGNDPFMVLEYVKGTELKQVLEKHGRLGFEGSKRIICQVLEALAEAHELGIVHRDLKPANIMLTGKGIRTSAKVLDFGIAGVLDSFGDGITEITELGQIRGTPLYMAPEQYTAFSDPYLESDIYSMGLILLECLTGEKAIKAKTKKEAYEAHLNLPLEIPPKIRGSAIGDIVVKACQKEPEDRYRSAQEMLEALFRIEQEPERAALSQTNRLDHLNTWAEEPPATKAALLADLAFGQTATGSEEVPALLQSQPSPAVSSSLSAGAAMSRTQVVLAVVAAIVLLCGGLGLALYFFRTSTPVEPESMADAASAPQTAQRDEPAVATTDLVAPSVKATATGTPEGGTPSLRSTATASQEGDTRDLVGDQSAMANLSKDEAGSPPGDDPGLAPRLSGNDSGGVPPELMRQASLAAGNHRHAEALALFETFLAQHPAADAERSEAIFGAAQASLQLGRTKEAKAYYETYRSTFPNGDRIKDVRKALRALRPKVPAVDDTNEKQKATGSEIPLID